ncbi:gamma-glutamyltransferase family protein [Nocardia huaxiensis]|uniref:Gamma-glutamyltransferase family protein n=1 Tax=Nocardia huaxiensis TaxID=2755382 RepID=A0A7D6VGD7_9NOCA|nr:gamma-glutamyltransferase family protein [Nocardia huaxiensis]QLY29030.1 gamma-glutamyltransferase family protein [Nocardia huaxiensis]
MRRTRRHIWSGAAATLLLLTGLATACSSDGGDAQAVCTAADNGTLVTPRASGTGTTTPADIRLRPEITSGYRTGMTPVRTNSFAVSTANPHATEAACRVLRDGGTAADALIVAQTVLGLVEPQSSGIGGGAFLLYYNASTGTVDAYDGRETAPQAATQDYLRWVSDTDRTVPQPNARASGRAIGVPGVLRLLESVHREHGKQPWADMFGPAITLADQGFEISPRLAAQIAESANDLARDENARTYFLQADGTPKTSGSTLLNPAYAKTLGALATDGANAFYTGAIAADIVDATADTSGGRTPGLLSLADLSSYETKKRTVLCTPYRTHQVCGMPNPSSGGITVAATLGILANFDLAALRPDDSSGDSTTARNGGEPKPEAVHLISEAERLAYADRDKYIADADFIPMPGNSPQTLINPDYLKQRASLINPDRSMGTAQPGDFGPVPLGTGPQPPEHGTSHISIIDSYGNAATMTTTVEAAFGSFHLVDGFILNNQLTDFAADPVGKDGNLVANRLEPGKRPRSSMAPTLVFDLNADGSRGPLTHVTGSPGGSVIIQFVLKSLVGMLDWGLNPQQAVSLVSFGAGNSPTTNVGGENPNIDPTDSGKNDPLVTALLAKGHQVSVAPQSSGLSVLARDGDGLIGGADPRREGAVMGDTR